MSPRNLINRALRPVAQAARLVTPLGWLVVAIGLASWTVSWWLGWDEFSVVAAGCLLAIAIGSLFMIGRDRIDVEIFLVPPRVVAGETASGRITATNAMSRRIFPFRLEAPVGLNYIRSDVPSLAADAVHEESFRIPTTRRTVIPVGPASSVRGDPIGMMRREVAFTERLDLFVHPKTVSLANLASGWVRDLEGLSTNDLSPSDVELHTLREYVPGDDRRLVHWRTTARLGTLMVRQFVDTRRSHLELVLCTAEGDYADEDEFELAVSIAGSLGVRALRDKQELTCIAGKTAIHTVSPNAFLDGLSGVVFGEGPADLSATAVEAARITEGASVIAILSGSRTSVPALRLAAQQFPVDLRIIAIKAVAGGRSALRPIGNITALEVSELDKLERLLMAANRA